MKSTKGWLLFIAVATVVWIGLCECCQGSPVDSVCEVSHPKGSGNVVGSGVCVRNQGEVWTLTNAHVIRGHRGKIYTQWVWKGVPSKKLEATEVWRLDSPTIDMAVLRQPIEPFGDRVPLAATMLPKGVVLPKGSILYTIGCPGGANPTMLECRLVAYQQHRAGMILTPRVEGGRSGSPVFSEDGRYLVGLVDSWDRDQPSKYGSALYASQLRATLSRMIPQAAKPVATVSLVAKPVVEEEECRLFDGDFCNRAGCQRHGGQQQQATPPGTGKAYPELPPLAGIGADETDSEVDNLRERIEFLELTLRDVTNDLSNKEIQLKSLFGEDYGLMKQVAADARDAKAVANDAQKAADAATAKASVLPEDIDHWGVIRDGYYDIKAWRRDIEGEDGEGGRLAKIKAVIGLATNPMALLGKLSWPLGGILAAIAAVWIRVEWKRRNEQEFKTKTGEFLSRGTGAVAGFREDIHDRLADGFALLLNKAREIRQHKDDDSKMSEAATLLKEIQK